MPRLLTKFELADLAETFAIRRSVVEHKGHLYIPVHYDTLAPDASLTPEETIWILLDHELRRWFANKELNILFATDSEERSFTLMLRQFSRQVVTANGLLVRVEGKGVMRLLEDGTLVPADGSFTPNYLNVPYDPDTKLADELFKVISEWVGGDENAHSLLYHLATALQPGFSAVKYVLLIGSGRNGKSTLLKMLEALLGKSNRSEVKRQDMAVRSPIITSLNNKLINIVFDGPKEFVKDSSTEKTLIAGESLQIEMKYENAPFQVQTNALFIEGLQQEPRVSDKSAALQKRLVRFKFPMEYPLDLLFEEKMLRPEMLAALLKLLLTHWVNRDELATKLAPTVEALDLQMQAVWSASPLMRFLEWSAGRDVKFLQDILTQKMPVDKFLVPYRSWLDQNGYKNMEDDYLLQQLNDHFTTDRKSFRVDNKPTTKRYIKTVLPDTRNTIELLLQGAPLNEDVTILDD